MSELIFPLFQWLEQSALAALMRDSDRLMALCAVAHPCRTLPCWWAPAC